MLVTEYLEKQNKYGNIHVISYKLRKIIQESVKRLAFHEGPSKFSL